MVNALPGVSVPAVAAARGKQQALSASPLRVKQGRQHLQWEAG